MYRQKANPCPANWLGEKRALGMSRNDWGLALLLAMIIAAACASQWSWVKFWIFGPV